ncbi:MAG: class I SAM-dependent methyltransferase, partial [Candidatus Kerfeldbacteria bacterium]|nr:class I SAM-dependent methyltransferase [Candidatus Kerfeldbacteria bacterium]
MSTTNQKKYLGSNPVQQWFLRRFLDRLVDMIASQQPVSILEVGCGEGYLLNQIHERLPDVKKQGYDVFEAALHEGRRLFPKLTLETGDIYDLPDDDSSWDLVVASEVLEHLANPDAALRELQRVAKRAVVLTVPHEPWFRLGNLGRLQNLSRFGNHPEHVNLWTKRQFA